MTEGRPEHISDEFRKIVADRYLKGSPLGDLLLALAHLLDPEQKPEVREQP